MPIELHLFPNCCFFLCYLAFHSFFVTPLVTSTWMSAVLNYSFHPEHKAPFPLTTMRPWLRTVKTPFIKLLPSIGALPVGFKSPKDYFFVPLSYIAAILHCPTVGPKWSIGKADHRAIVTWLDVEKHPLTEINQCLSCLFFLLRFMTILWFMCTRVKYSPMLAKWEEADSANLSPRLKEEALIVMAASHSRGHVAMWTMLFVTQALWRTCKVSEFCWQGLDAVVTKPVHRTDDCKLPFTM